MPNRISTLTLPRVPRAAVALVAAALLLVNASGIAHAALREASLDDSLILSTYGVTFVLVLVLIGLIVYKRVRTARELREFAASKRYEGTHGVKVIYREPAPITPTDPALVEERRSHERRSHALEGAQAWEKPQPGSFGSVEDLPAGNEDAALKETLTRLEDPDERVRAQAPKLLQMVAGEGLPENVRTAPLEVLYKLDQDQPVFELAASDNSPVSLHNSLYS